MLQPNGPGCYTFDVGCKQVGDYVVENKVLTYQCRRVLSSLASCVYNLPYKDILGSNSLFMENPLVHTVCVGSLSLFLL